MCRRRKEEKAVIKHLSRVPPSVLRGCCALLFSRYQMQIKHSRAPAIISTHISLKFIARPAAIAS
jgi:hypothetical protein